MDEEETREKMVVDMKKSKSDGGGSGGLVHSATFACMFLEAALKLFLPGQRFQIFNPTVVYDHLGKIFAALIFGSLVFCISLYIIGHLAPSSIDSGLLGNFIIDWGMGLYPRIGRHFDVKVSTNCRFWVMFWAVLGVTYWKQQSMELVGMMSTAVLAVTNCIKQGIELVGMMSLAVLAVTYWKEQGIELVGMMSLAVLAVTYWKEQEAGCWNTMDIVHFRAIYIYMRKSLCILAAGLYTSPGMYLVNHSVHRGTQIIAAYTKASSETKSSLLLASGWRKMGMTASRYVVIAIVIMSILAQATLKVDGARSVPGKLYDCKVVPDGTMACWGAHSVILPSPTGN